MEASEKTFQRLPGYIHNRFQGVNPYIETKIISRPSVDHNCTDVREQKRRNACLFLSTQASKRYINFQLFQ